MAENKETNNMKLLHFKLNVCRKLHHAIMYICIFLGEISGVIFDKYMSLADKYEKLLNKESE